MRTFQRFPKRADEKGGFAKREIYVFTAVIAWNWSNVAITKLNLYECYEKKLPFDTSTECTMYIVQFTSHLNSMTFERDG